MHKTLYLCRHAECEFNARAKVQGWSDSPLTELGILQCETAYRHLKEIGVAPQAYFCSTCQRTAETLMRMTGVEEGSFTRVADLREMYFGLLEGESCDLVTAEQPLGDFLIPFGGETEVQVTRRMNDAITKIMHESPADVIFIVSHGTSSTCFKKYWHPHDAIPASNELVGNCGVLTYAYDGEVFSLQEMYTPKVPPRKEKWIPKALR